MIRQKRARGGREWRAGGLQNAYGENVAILTNPRMYGSTRTPHRKGADAETAAGVVE
jgi:hypothetical protein